MLEIKILIAEQISKMFAVWQILSFILNKKYRVNYKFIGILIFIL